MSRVQETLVSLVTIAEYFAFRHQQLSPLTLASLAVATGAVIQFRFLGGLIGLSIASNVMNSYLKAHLKDILSSDALVALLKSPKVLATFGPDVQEKVIKVFAQSYDLQYTLMIAFAAAQFPAAVMIWKKKEQIKAG